MDVFVINMIPKSLSGETNQDSEPNLAVDPADPRNIAATAFTSDPLSGPHAPIYTSSDGGHTWSLNSIVPGGSSTHDITLHFASNSHVLYGGILRDDDSHLNVLRTGNFLGAGAMTILEDRSNEDQPWTEAITAPVSGTPDRIYVGNNDFNTAPQTATIDLSQNAATPPPPAGVAPHGISSRTPGSQNGPPTRPVAHSDGTVYAVYVDWHQAYFGNGNYTSDIVVCRDDNWGQGATPFTALTDPGDHKAGYRVAASTTLPWQNFVNFMGQERGGNHVAIAVSPRDSDTVYVAWADYPGGNPPLTLHLQRSTTRGTSWVGDLRTVESVINPALAIDEHGRVGFLYQALTNSGTSWETCIEISDDGFTGSWRTLVLCKTPSNAPARTFWPYLGDYVRLQTVGSVFYGVFCANNTPDHANFPQGVVYQRNADFATHTLLAVDDVTPVPISIDPFFFKITFDQSRLVTAIAGGGSFGTCCIGSFVNEPLTINNAGTARLRITSILSSSPNFLVPSVASYPIVVEPGGSVDVVVRFQPTSLGLHSATLTIVSNDPSGPHVVHMWGDAPSGILTVSGSTHFGGVQCCHREQRTIELCNTGSCDLHVTRVHFKEKRRCYRIISDPFPATLKPGSCLGLVVEYRAKERIARGCELVIDSDDPTDPIKSIELLAYTLWDCCKPCGAQCGSSCSCGCKRGG
jgi:hypothetical protein